MRLTTTLVLSFLSLVSFSQDALSLYNNRPAHSFYFSREECNTGSNSDVQSYLEKKLSCSLQIKERRANAFGSIIEFKEVNYGAEVFQGYAKVLLNDKDNAVQVFYDIFENLPITQSTPGRYWLYDKGWKLASRSLVHDYSTGSLFEIFKDDIGKTILQRDLALHSGPVDSVIRVNVFNTDPLTTAHKQYGNGYVDSNDIDLVLLNAQRVWKNVRCRYDNDTFFVENKYLEAHKYDQSFLHNPVHRIHDTVFDYTRHQAEFENIMILYHISAYQDYLNSIGVLAGYLPIPFDAHGNNTDNSSFIPSSGFGFWGVQFGTGGIDDAEDGEVIVHEYTHSLREFSSPGSAIGIERMSVEEGTCDYMATSYKMSIDTFGWRKFAYWDGNNPPLWSGRDVASRKIYPDALTGDFYKNGEIWSSALMRLYFKLGKTIVDQLVMQTLNYYAANQSMSQCAWLVIKSDSVLFSGVHAMDIQRTFAETHILPWPSGITGKKQATEISLRNSVAFMQGKGNLEVVLPMPGNGHYMITNALGQEVLEKEFRGDAFQVSRDDFKGSGFYILTVNTSLGSGSYKFILE
jgi:hypothetical protein